MRRRPYARGSVLVIVLLAALLLALSAIALTLTVTLDGLAARNVQDAALAEGQAEAALQLAARDLGAGLADGGTIPVGLGPWEPAGVRATATVSRTGPNVYTIVARATVGRSQVVRTLVVGYDAVGEPVVLARP